MAFFGKYWYETRELVSLAVPTTLSTFLETSMVVEDVIMLGHLGKGHVAALAIGNGFFNIMWYFLEGFLTAQDTLCSNAYGQGDPKALRYWCYVSMFATFFVCAAATVLFFFSELILGSFFFINFHLKTKACVHIYIMTPAFWFMALYRIAQKYLQARGIMSPSVRASLIGNGLNIGLNYVFIFLFGFGFAGCAASTTCTRLVMLLVLYRHVKKSGEMFGIHAELGELLRNTPVESGARAVGTAIDKAQEALEKIPADKVRRGVGSAVAESGRRMNVPWLLRWGQNLESDSSSGDGRDVEMTSSSTMFGGFFDFSKEGEEERDRRRRMKSGTVMPYDGGLDSAESSRHSHASSSSEEDDDDEDDDEDGAKPLNIRLPKGRQPEIVSPLSTFAATLHKEEKAAGGEEEEEEEGGYLNEVHISDESYHRRTHGGGQASGRVSPEREREEEEDEDDDDEQQNRPLLASDQSAREAEPASPFMVGSLSVQGPRGRFIIRFIRFWAIGIPGALMCGLENWIFVVMAMFVARMGSIPLAATQILVVWTEMVFLSVPFSLSVASAGRVGAALGSNNVDKARTTAATSYAIGSVLVLGGAAVVWTMPEYLGYVFTDNEDIVYRASLLARIAAAFQAAYGMVGLSQGVLRAQGRQSELAGFTFAALYLLGLPLAYFWGFWVRPTHGLAGFWAGLTIGMGALALVLLLLVFVTDWHRETRRARVRLARERQGFAQESSSRWGDWSSGAGAGSGSGASSGSAGPLVGRPMLGSRAVGGFSWGYTSLQEEMDEAEQVDIVLAQQDAVRSRA